MFNLLILSFMDAVQPEPLSTRAHQGHALSIGFGLVLIGIAGLGLSGSSRLPAIGWIGLYTPALIAPVVQQDRSTAVADEGRSVKPMTATAGSM